MTLADVTVVIPCFNSSGTIGRALRSVQHQTHVPREIIIVDDGSNDDLERAIDVIRPTTPHLNIRYARHNANSGAANARNQGWDLATCTYIAFLDADDEWFPEKIERQLDVMLKRPNLAISGHRYTEILVETQPQRHLRLRAITLWRLLFRNYFSTPSVMIRRDVSTRFRTGWSHSEDYLLWLETVAHYGAALLIDEPLVRLHKPAYGASGLSADTSAMQHGEIQAYRHLHENGDISKVWYLLAIAWSFTRYVRRLLLLRVRRL